jgi:hypothetical protein
MNRVSEIIAVPEFEGFFEGVARQFRIAITDHDPLIIETAVGLMACINIWCPETPIAPSLNPTEGKGVLTPASQIEQMKRIAQYLFDLATTGVVCFSLQEVPNPKHHTFTLLSSELKKLCDSHNLKSNNAPPIMLELQHWSSTSGTRSGTCVLVDTHKLSVSPKQLKSKIPEMNGRFSCFEIQDKNNRNIKFDLYDIHGDFKNQNSTADFVLACVKQGAMVCGDLNITDGSNAAKKLEQALPKSKHYLSDKGRINTIDVFYDPYSPSLTQQNQVQLTAPRQQVLGISRFKVVKGMKGMIQLHFPSESEAANFLAKAQEYFKDQRTIVARKDSPTIIRLSQQQYEQLQREYPEALEDLERLSPRK